MYIAVPLSDLLHFATGGAPVIVDRLLLNVTRLIFYFLEAPLASFMAL